MGTSWLTADEAEDLSLMFEATNWDSMRSVSRVINTWADSVFPDRAPEAQLSKLVMEEIPELLIHRKKQGIEGIGTELADCFILLMDLAVVWNVDLQEAILTKMKKNAERTWSKDTATGFYNHLEADSEHPVSGSNFTLEDSRRTALDNRAGFQATDCRGTPLQGVVPGTVVVRHSDGWHYPQLVRTASGWGLGACARCGRNLDWGSAVPDQADNQRPISRNGVQAKS